MLIYYSLMLTGSPKDRDYLCQFLSSLHSLRQHNSQIPVCLHLISPYAKSPVEAQIEDLYQVQIVRSSSYPELLDQLCPDYGRFLHFYPMLQKHIPFAELFASDHSEILYVDNDTFFYADPLQLVSELQGADFVAREEPHSKASWQGYLPDLVNEEILSLFLTSNTTIQAFNTGVILWNRQTLKRFHEQIDLFFSTVLRLIKGFSFSHSQLEQNAPFLVAGRLIQQWDTAENYRALPHPSRNYWIVDQAALWSTLSQLGLTQAIFSTRSVLQGCEEVHFPGRFEKPVLSHYFSKHTSDYFASESKIVFNKA